jgi:head-tail adaptor
MGVRKMSYESLLNQVATVYRKTTGTGKPIEEWKEITKIKCMVTGISSQEMVFDELARLNVNYKVFILPKSLVKVGDKLVVGQHSLLVKFIEDVALRGKVIICWTTKI